MTLYRGPAGSASALCVTENFPALKVKVLETVEHILRMFTRDHGTQLTCQNLSEDQTKYASVHSVAQNLAAKGVMITVKDTFQTFI